MRRRAFVCGIGALLAVPTAAAQPAMRRIAILEFTVRASRADVWQVLTSRLEQHGYVEGRNLSVERRWADDAVAKLPQLAKELLATQPEVVLVSTTPATQVLKGLTQTVPIVITGSADPVATGLVASFARPGGNVTGVSMQLAGLATKRLEMLRELKPQARRIGMLGPASNAGVQVVYKQLQQVAQARAMEVRLFDAPDAAAIGRAFEAMAADRVDALIVAQIMLTHHPQIIELATRHHMPATFVDRPILEAGGLLVLGPDRESLYRHAADQVHRILQGAKPGDLPIVQATEFWMGVNLRTARALGLKVPQSVLLRADRVIE